MRSCFRAKTDPASRSINAWPRRTRSQCRPSHQSVRSGLAAHGKVGPDSAQEDRTRQGTGGWARTEHQRIGSESASEARIGDDGVIGADGLIVEIMEPGR